MNPDIWLLFRRSCNYFIKHRKARYTAIAVLSAVLLFSVLYIMFPLPYERLERDYSIVHMTEDGELLRISLSPGGRYRIRHPLSSISPYVIKGIIEYEDKMFYYHPGVNPYAVLRALYLNITSGRIVSGGSTITQQVAKLIDPRERTYTAKLIEMFRAFQLELKYTKKEILEIYLNIIPMGGNIEGVSAASYLYFNKHPRKLTPGEAALLIALPKRPNAVRPDRNPEAAGKARNSVLHRIKDRLELGSAEVEAACRESVPDERYKNPYALQQLVNRNFEDDNFIREYYIDRTLQEFCEYKLKDTVDSLKKDNVFNGAVLVVENSTMRVRVYAASPDFNDKKHCGEIDGINIYRSPGSTLKPFIYALAVEKGMLTPKKVVYDIPRDYGGYSPVNFDRNFRGPVTMSEALAMSYNTPAVYYEYLLGEEGLYGFLRSSDIIDVRRRKEDPGLALALGAFPATLEEITTLYACLANGGSLKRLKYTKYGEKHPAKSRRMFSPGTAWIISKILSEAVRPDLPQSWEFTNSRGRAAFKTGTSFGFSDAWAIGYNPDYTVGVWLGNADASPSFRLIGIKAAAPLLIEIFNFLTRNSDSWFDRPYSVKTREICPVSGCLPGPYCPRRDTDYYVSGRTVKEQCKIHRQIYINKKTGLRADSASRKYEDRHYIKKTVEYWPADAAAFMRKQGMHVDYIPPYGENEMPERGAGAPVIVSPENGNTYYITAALPEEYQKIPLTAATEGCGEKVFWLINGRVVAQGSSDRTFYIRPEPGKWEIVLQGPTGETDKASFTVKDKR
ncbi:MAG: penicillin-binding protein 1C [Candidatus Goldiibacteriota bacterium]